MPIGELMSRQVDYSTLTHSPYGHCMWGGHCTTYSKLTVCFEQTLGSQWRAGSTLLFQSPAQFVVGLAVSLYVCPKACEKEGI